MQKEPHVKLLSKPKINQNTSELAEYYLRTRGALHYKELLRLIKKKGWVGSGDDRRDEKTLHQILSSNVIFRPRGKRSGIFELGKKSNRTDGPRLVVQRSRERARTELAKDGRGASQIRAESRYAGSMSLHAMQLLEAFDALPEDEKRIVTAELLRRAIPFDSGPLDDEETARAADDLLTMLDAEENDANAR
ncbi:MAG: hypothetical protein LAO79_27140 [Acidobacteriia bacterium]|nr:hypothetical protein [Terriglobia bacterium]